MRTALFADIHGNVEALRACLRHARDAGAERYAFLGDLVGYGADPGAVVDMVAECASNGAIVVKGNHDLAVEASTLSGFSDGAADVLEWTRAALGPTQREFLAGLPLTVRTNGHSFIHASHVAPEDWIYIHTAYDARESILASGGATYVFSGHVHEQALYVLTQAGKTIPFRPTSGSPVPVPSHRRWLALVGSVGQPRDGNPAAAYALFDDVAVELKFFRVPYDHFAAAEKIRRAGLPAWIAQRLQQGV